MPMPDWNFMNFCRAFLRLLTLAVVLHHRPFDFSNPQKSKGRNIYENYQSTELLPVLHTGHLYWTTRRACRSIWCLQQGWEAYECQKYRYKAQYSLDRGDGIEHDILFVSLSPDEIYERKLTTEQLHAAIAALPDKQAKRIYAHYFMGMNKTAIAKAEGVSEKAIRIAIERGLQSIEKYLKSFF